MEKTVRLEHEDITYEVGIHVNEVAGIKIPSPYFWVTMKSAKKHRGVKHFSDKRDANFCRIPVKNVIGFYKKVYVIFEDLLKDYNYVSFSAYKDDKEKRTRIYTAGLEKLGFKTMYVYTCPWDKSFTEHILSREGYQLKRKEIKRIISSMYGEYELQNY